MEYRKIGIHVAVLWLTLGVLSVNSLIGLRPPQHKDDSAKNKRQKNGSHLKGSPTLTFSQQQDRSRCYFPELFRCSSLLLQQSIWNQSSFCDRINSFTQCSTAALSREGRRHYIKSLTRLKELTKPFYKTHRCSSVNVRQNQTHLRHMQAKDGHPGDCCISKLFNCTIRTFMASTAGQDKKKCDIFSSYKQCLLSSPSSCEWESFLANFPALTSFNLNCKEI